MRKFALIGVMALAGCASQNQYIRADGQNVSLDQVQADRAGCANSSDDNYCMVEKGYFQVAADKAAEKQAQLAAIAEEQRRQAELAAQAKAEQERRAAAEARKRAAARKKKKRPVAQKN